MKRVVKLIALGEALDFLTLQVDEDMVAGFEAVHVGSGTQGASKCHVSPHEFIQAVAVSSKNRFGIGKPSDPVQFCFWLLDALHRDLGGTEIPNSSIVFQCFQGELEETTVIPARAHKPEVRHIPFLRLRLDLPPPPLFKDPIQGKIIPRVPLATLLRKFDGETVTDCLRPQPAQKRYRVTRLPRYLLLHMGRFATKKFEYCKRIFAEKNPTLVNFPVKNLELRDHIPLPDRHSGSKYDLVATVVHDGTAMSGSYRALVHSKCEGAWYQIQDLCVESILPQLVALSEPYMQIYEQQPVPS
ncbi:U4/U6.U5 tri-snRNP-associated protein 2-like [Selaginella moellendorffii]|uniref:U4/U6.U5 tri-snRNP-associated protein 2-like n=1 Tax=Selaginella moellendorffii TaxID=88036 RepID=UPI000D1C4863|nr:U4/U6.U5 tri-snRNP-associated protein 2-like [Selaginella moellendorffii]|eukprot:XP_024524552.1 U4/U6.U5 tri-snRNP-associated protein 2-like [Selaginella moellendorffii]